MNKNLIFGLIALLVIGGGAFFLVNSSSDDEQNNTETSDANGSEMAQSNTNEDNPSFNPLATVDQPFVATINGTSGGEMFEGTIEYDGQGNIYFQGNQNGEQSEFYVANDQFIACQEGECFAFPSDQSTSSFDLDQFNYSTEEFDTFRNQANYQGTESCPAGTCHVWEVTDDDGFTSKLFLNTDDNRISKVEANNNGEVTTLEYEFREVTITIPENVQTLDGILPQGA